MRFNRTLGFISSFSEEYYSSHLEINIPWTRNKSANMSKKLELMCNKIPEDTFMISDKKPSYVGTHIHYVLENNKTLVTEKIENIEIHMFNEMLKWYINYFENMIDTKRMDHVVVLETVGNELQRLLMNHNILINFDKEFLGGFIHTFLRERGHNYHYTNGIDNLRYRPMIWSEARGDKPFTMEIRYISNMVWLDAKALKSFNNMVVEALNKTPDENLMKTTKKNYAKLFSIYDAVIHAYINMGGSGEGCFLTLHQYKKFLKNELIKEVKGITYITSKVHRHLNLNRTYVFGDDAIILNKKSYSINKRERKEILLRIYRRMNNSGTVISLQEMKKKVYRDFSFYMKLKGAERVKVSDNEIQNQITGEKQRVGHNEESFDIDRFADEWLNYYDKASYISTQHSFQINVPTIIREIPDYSTFLKICKVIVAKLDRRSDFVSYYNMSDERLLWLLQSSEELYQAYRTNRDYRS